MKKIKNALLLISTLVMIFSACEKINKSPNPTATEAIKQKIETISGMDLHFVEERDSLNCYVYTNGDNTYLADKDTGEVILFSNSTNEETAPYSPISVEGICLMAQNETAKYNPGFFENEYERDIKLTAEGMYSISFHHLSSQGNRTGNMSHVTITSSGTVKTVSLHTCEDPESVDRENKVIMDDAVNTAFNAIANNSNINLIAQANLICHKGKQIWAVEISEEPETENDSYMHYLIEVDANSGEVLSVSDSLLVSLNN